MTDIKHTAAQPLDLDKLEALAKAATPGPWMRLFGERTIYDRMEDGCRGNAIVRADQAYSAKDAANLDFIAAANPATILALIAQARTARLDTTASAVGERIAKLRGALKEVSEVRFGNDGDCGTTRIAEDALYADEQAAAKAPAAQAVPAPSIRTLEFVSLMNAWRNADILNAPAAYDAITAHIDAKLAASPASTPEASQQAAAVAAPSDWSECQRIADLPAVDEAMRGFLDDPTNDSGVMVVRAVLESVAATTSEDALIGQWLIEQGFKHANVDLTSNGDGDPIVIFEPRFYIPEPVGMSYDEGEWTVDNIRTAIRAAMRATQQEGE